MYRAIRVLKTAVLVLVLAVALGFGGTQPVAADNCSAGGNALECVCTPGSAAQDSSVCSTDANKDPITGDDGVLKKASLLLALLAGIIAVILILIGSVQYILSAGDAQKAASARQMILGAVVGLVIIAVAYSIVVFVVSKLV